jgi:hypothetical protein
VVGDPRGFAFSNRLLNVPRHTSKEVPTKVQSRGVNEETPLKDKTLHTDFFAPEVDKRFHEGAPTQDMGFAMEGR